MLVSLGKPSLRPIVEVQPQDRRQRGGMSLLNTRVYFVYEPVEHDCAELGLNAAQQLQLEEVLTEAICAPVAGTHAVETGVAAERYTEMRVFTTTPTHTNTEGHTLTGGGTKA